MMNRNRKSGRFIAAVAALCLAAVLGGCGDGAGDTPPSVIVTAGADNANPVLAADLTITLTGSATIAGGSIASYEWSTQSAPTGVTPSFGTATLANTTVTGLTKAGAYVFKLTATSAAGVAGVKTVTVNVAPITKTVTVPIFNPSLPTSSLDFGAVSTISGWDANFPASNVYYTLSVDGGAAVSSNTSTVVNTTSLSNGNHTITQTFYYNDGNPITNGNRTGTIGVGSGSVGAISVPFSEINLLLNKNEL